MMNDQHQHTDQLPLKLQLTYLIIQIAIDHTQYNNAICNNINNSTFIITSIDHTIARKCKYTPVSPTGASIFHNHTINNRNQLYFQHFIVASISHMN